MDDRKSNRAIIKHQAEIERVKNIEKFPSDIRRDWRKDFSSRGPRINAMIKGAASYLNFLNRKPITPKMNIINTSNVLC